MNTIETEHDVRDAVHGMAAGASTPALPSQAILRAGARRRTRRRVGRVTALALAATSAVSVSWTAMSGGFSASPASRPTVTNPFTEQLGRVLEQVLPGAKVSASMYGDTNPGARHERTDSFPLRITYRGRDLDASITLSAFPASPANAYSDWCVTSLPWETSRSNCISKALPADGGVSAYELSGPGKWNNGGFGSGGKPLTVIEANIINERPHTVQAQASMSVRVGNKSNESGLTPAKVSAALEDPRFTTFLAAFADHPESDPYGPLAKINDKIVASGTVGTHKWDLHFAIVSESDTPPGHGDNNNCDYWEYTVDGASMTGDADVTCQMDGSAVHHDLPTDKAHPHYSQLLSLAHGVRGWTKKNVIGSVLSSTVPAGTVSVEATFDDQPTKITGKAFTVHGDIPYFAVVKPDGATPDWKTAVVKCLDADGKAIGTLYFDPPNEHLIY